MRNNGANSSDRMVGDVDTVDAVFDALSDQRRRFILRYVIDRSDGVGFDELAERIDERKHETDGRTSKWDDHELIRADLYHALLPKLDDAGLVEFDRNQGTVHPTANERRLDLCRDLMARVSR